MQGQSMSGQGVYPGYLLQQGLQYLQHPSLPSPYCLPLQSLQPLQLPSSLYSYPSPYLGQAVTSGQGEEQEVSPSLHTPREPNRDTSLSPRLEVPGEQEERDDYLAELAREREVLQSRGGREAVNNVLRILERGTGSPPDHDTSEREIQTVLLVMILVQEVMITIQAVLLLVMHRPRPLALGLVPDETKDRL